MKNMALNISSMNMKERHTLMHSMISKSKSSQYFITDWSQSTQRLHLHAYYCVSFWYSNLKTFGRRFLFISSTSMVISFNSIALKYYVLSIETRFYYKFVTCYMKYITSNSLLNFIRTYKHFFSMHKAT